MVKKFVLINNLFLIVIFPFKLLGYDSILLNELPETSKIFIEDNFHNTNIKNINKINNRFHVLLEEDFLLIFDDSGNWYEVDGKNKAIPTNFIPENVMYTVNKTNPNTKILKILKK